MSSTILLVEDDVEHSRLIAESLRSTQQSCRVIAVGSASSALRSLNEYPIDCALLDYSLPDTEDLECLEQIRERRPDLPVIIVTGLGSEEVAVRAMKLGAVDYLVKHGRYLRQVARIVREALGHSAAHPAAKPPRPIAAADSDPTGALIGTSRAMQEVRRFIREASRCDAAVLIEGETGTGKELVARAIHACGARCERPFIAINSAAIPESLFENELFGHTQGAFTGAHRDSPGLFGAAHGGTLFLDEIGELPMKLQAKLLRVLESGTYRPLGSTAERSANVRVVAASNRALRALVGEGTFRADLYYRLHVLDVRIPPLRERGDDIALLAAYFLRRHAPAAPPAISDAALAQLANAAWIGNVRELEHTVQRTLLRAGDRIDAFAVDDTNPGDRPEGAERAELVQLLERHHGRIPPVAQALGVSPRTVQRRVRHHSLEVRRFRRRGPST